VDESGIPDVAWRTPDGRAMAVADWQASENRSLIAALYEAGSRALVVLHAGEEPIRVTLPTPRPEHRWHLIADSRRPEAHGPVEQEVEVAGRSVLLVVETATASG